MKSCTFEEWERSAAKNVTVECENCGSKNVICAGCCDELVTYRCMDCNDQFDQEAEKPTKKRGAWRAR